MKKTLTAAVAAVMLTAAPFAAFGQTMGEGLSMLEAAIDNQFSALGITDYQMGELTLSQLSTIRSVLSSSDYSQTEKKQQVEAILRRSQ